MISTVDVDGKQKIINKLCFSLGRCIRNLLGLEPRTSRPLRTRRNRRDGIPDHAAEGGFDSKRSAVSPDDAFQTDSQSFGHAAGVGRLQQVQHDTADTG